MAHIDADRVKETTTTTGTGAITLAGAVVGFRSFSSAMSIGDTCSYAVVSATGLEWETGIGTYSGATTLTRTTIKSSANNTSPPTAMVFTAGVKDVFIGPIAGTLVPYNPVTGALNLGVDALNDVAITSPTSGQVIKYSGTAWTNQADAVNVGTVTSVAVSGGTTGLTVSGSPITGAGTITVAGTLAVANGGTGVTTSTGTTNLVLSNSPTLVTPLSNTLSAVPVGSGAGNALTISAGSGVTSGAGGSLILQAGLQATSGGDGKVIVKQVSGQTGDIFNVQTSTGQNLIRVKNGGPFNYYSIGNDSQNGGAWMTQADGMHYFCRGDQQSSAFGAVGYYSTPWFNLVPNGLYAWSQNGASLHYFADTALGRNAAGVVEINNGTAGAFRDLTLRNIVMSGALSAVPVASGLTASVTAATGNGTNITYTATNTFTVGRTVSVTGLTTATGTTLNIAGMTIATASSTQFTVVNATVGTSSGTGTATAGGNTLADAASNAVTAGPGGNRVIRAGDGVGVGKGGDIILQPGAQGSSGGNGTTIIKGQFISLGDFGSTTRIYLGATNAGTSITTGGGNATATLLDQYGNPAFQWGGGTLVISNSGSIRFNATTVYQFNGTSSSFPALKQVGTQLQVRLADDSAAASLSASSVNSNALAAMPVTVTSAGNALAVSAGNALTTGAGGNLTLTAGSGVGVGAGGNLILKPGAQGSSGGNGWIKCVDVTGANTRMGIFNNSTQGYGFGWDTQNNSTLGSGLRSSGVNGVQYISLLTQTTPLLSIDGNGITSVATPTIYAKWRFLLVNGITSETGTGSWALSCSTSPGTAIVRDGQATIAGGSLAFPSSTTNVTASVNDLALPASAFQRINCTTASSITGIAPPSGSHTDGRMIRVYNVGAVNLTLTHNSGVSASANRFWNTTAADIVLGANDYAELIYDSTSNGSGNAGWRVR